MAAIESKRSSSRTQPATHKALKPKKQTNIPASLRFTETKRGKTTIRRYRGRTFYRFEEVKGKTVDFIEVFVCADYNCVDVRLADKTSLTFAIEPAFTLEPQYADWKSGDLRRLKNWPLIYSESHRS